jgi:hypothetical protein
MQPNQPVRAEVVHNAVHPIDEKMLEYQRQTKVACQVIAVFVSIFSILTIIGAIYMAVQIAKISNSPAFATCDSTVQVCP